jgi:LacI family transcriptional regulator
MQKRATIKDIAKDLGVSVSTVSRGLKDHPDISVGLRAQIKQRAEELHYHPNQMASGLRKRSSKIIALIIPEITMFFFPSVIKGIEEVVKQNGYQLLVLQSNDRLESERQNIEICFDHSVEGLLISLSNQSHDVDHLLKLKSAGVPVVLFDKSLEDSPFDEVIIDDEAAAYQATQHLLYKGCGNIVAALGSENLTMSKKRAEGVRRALLDCERDVRSTYVYAANFDDGRSAMKKALAEVNPDGVFLMSDELIAASSKLLMAQYGVHPEQCYVIGFSDGVLPDIVDYPVSFVHHSGFELGKLAANRLMKRLFLLHETTEEEKPQRILLPVSLRDNF